MFHKRFRTPYPGAPEGAVVYAIGDIHGCDALLATMHRSIDNDHRIIGGEKHEIYLGDYIDRGADSSAVVERLIRRSREHATYFIRGNHEDLLARCLSGDIAWPKWRDVGGDQTVRSYGLDVSAAEVDEAQFREKLGARIPLAHREFFANLQPSYWFGEYFFTHAGVRPLVELDAQSEIDLMWIRGEFLRHDGPFGKIVVHGHSPTPKPEFRPNRINIDTMAFKSGVLTCLRIGPDGAMAASVKRRPILRERGARWPRVARGRR